MGAFEFFPWRESERLTSGEPVVRPLLDVDLVLGDLEIRTPALIDTGAPRCLFPRGVADVLGLRFPPKSHLAVRQHLMLGRSWAAITHMVTLSVDSVAGMVWEAEVDFLFDEGLSFGVLGLEGFLNKWAVTFVGGRNYFVVESTDGFERRVPPEPFDEFQRRWPEPH